MMSAGQCGWWPDAIRAQAGLGGNASTWSVTTEARAESDGLEQVGRPGSKSEALIPGVVAGPEVGVDGS